MAPEYLDHASDARAVPVDGAGLWIVRLLSFRLCRLILVRRLGVRVTCHGWRLWSGGIKVFPGNVVGVRLFVLLLGHWHQKVSTDADAPKKNF